jgi:N utilization substance protein B
MKRRQAREYALQYLFQSDFIDNKPELAAFWEDKGDPDTIAFAKEIAIGTIRNLEQIEKEIVSVAQNWDLDRMAVVDKNILRFATFELVFRDDIPPAVSINEALEIAKKYSSTESVSFINGILDKVAKKNKGK